MIPRPYQTRIINAVEGAYPEHRRILFSSATGTGKGVMGAMLANNWLADADLRMGKPAKVLWLAHRDELIQQAVRDLEEITGEKPAIEKGQSHVHGTAEGFWSKVVVSSVQTMMREDRRAKFGPAEFGLTLLDECVSGDSLLETDVGTVPIRALPESGAKQVLTYDGIRVKLASILSWRHVGRQKVYRIACQNGMVLRATNDHPLWTQDGWKQVNQLRKGEKLLCRANVAADNYSNLSTNEDGRDSIAAQDINVVSDGEHEPNGRKSTRLFARRFLCVFADAANRFCRWLRRSINLSENVVVGDIRGIFMATTNVRHNGIRNSQNTKHLRFSEHFWVTPVFLNQMVGALIRVCQQLTGFLNRIGQNIKQPAFGGWHHSFRLLKTKAGANTRAAGGLRVCHASSQSMNSCGRKAVQKSSQKNGWISSATSVWHGGFVTTAVWVKAGMRRFILKDTISKALTVHAHGSTSTWETPYHRKHEPDVFSDCVRQPPMHSLTQLLFSYRQACDTSWVTISAISPENDVDVYDIGVEGTHCFFANGILVHNCHHAPAPEWAAVLNYFYPATLVGFTATVDRTDHVPLRQIFDHVPEGACYSLVEAISDGWSSPIRQEYIHVNLDFSKVRQSRGDLSAEALDEIIRQEEPSHAIASGTVKKAGDRKTIIFCPRVASAKMVAMLLNDRYAGSGSAHAVSGETPLDLRREIVSDFRHGRFQYLCNAMLFTEGVDLPDVSCVVISRKTKSRKLYEQMIGRGTRGGLLCPIAGKTDLLVIDLVGASEHKLLRAVDLLGGDFTAEVIEEAHRRVDERNEAGEAPDVLAELLAAEQIKDELERQRRIKVLAEAKLKTKTIDPFITADVPERETPEWWKGDPITDKQLEILKRNGVPTAGLDYGRAKQLCDEIVRRARDGECSFKQARILGSHGYDRHFPMELAGEIMGWMSSRSAGFRFTRAEAIRINLIKSGKANPVTAEEWIRRRYTWGVPEPKSAPVESGGPPDGWF